MAYFRIAYGLVLLWEVTRLAGRAKRNYLEPELLFKYWPFDFVHPWPAESLAWHFHLMGACAVLVVLGLWYRIAAAGLCFGITYVFLLDQAHYLNHVYLVCLISFLMVLVPAHRTASLDALRRPQLASATVPGWSLWLLRFQIGVPYFFGGLAKINGDWLRGTPLREWLEGHGNFPLLGPLFELETTVYVMAYGGLLFDLLVPFLMLRRATRLPAFAVALGFHLVNSGLFGIGIFPWFMIAATVVFFPPSWPRDAWRVIRSERAAPIAGLLVGAAGGFVLGSWFPRHTDPMHALIAAFGGGVLGLHIGSERDGPGLPSPSPEPPASAGRSPWVTRFLICWVGIQVLLPLRHFVIPGDVHWTEEGHQFAWHMKLRDKASKISFEVTDRLRGRTFEVDPKDHLTRRQVRKMGARPDLIVEFAHHLARIHGTLGIEVRARSSVKLNDHPWQPMVDPTVDLAAIPLGWGPPADWILPMKKRETRP